MAHLHCTVAPNPMLFLGTSGIQESWVSPSFGWDSILLPPALCFLPPHIQLTHLPCSLWLLSIPGTLFTGKWSPFGVACCPPTHSSEVTDGDGFRAEQHTWGLCSPSSPSLKMNTNKSREWAAFFVPSFTQRPGSPAGLCGAQGMQCRFSAELWVGGRSGGICSVTCSTTGAAHVWLIPPFPAIFFLLSLFARW